jgi:hypothetical protein
MLNKWPLGRLLGGEKSVGQYTGERRRRLNVPRTLDHINNLEADLSTDDHDDGLNVIST